jgi:hypothetical protein
MSLSPRILWSALLLLPSLSGPGKPGADPIEVVSGPVVLPLTGLALELPKDSRPGAVWSLSGSWSLTDSGTSFDARDVIDQKVGGNLITGTWVHIGYFNAGDCAAVVKELNVPDRWTAERDLYGHHWNVASGTWDFDNSLGRAPVVALCTPRPNRASLLIYRFFVGDTTTLSMEARLAMLAKDKLLERITGAWEADHFGPTQPTLHQEIKRRGEIEATRTVQLPKSRLSVALPTDGFVWLVRPSEANNASDFLDRMAPAVPDLSIEMSRVAGVSCGAIFQGGDTKFVSESAPTNIPKGWKFLGTMQLETNLERVICRESGGASLVVGLLTTPSEVPEAHDFASLGPLLGALAAASDARN